MICDPDSTRDDERFLLAVKGSAMNGTHDAIFDISLLLQRRFPDKLDQDAHDFIGFNVEVAMEEFKAIVSSVSMFSINAHASTLTFVRPSPKLA